MPEKEKAANNGGRAPVKNDGKSVKVWRVVAITAVVVLVGVIIFGLIQWGNYRKQVGELQSQPNAKTSLTSNVQSISEDSNEEQAATATVVKIPEAGIQFGVPSGYPTITYKSNGDGTYAIVASDTINAGSMCQATDGSVGILVGNTRERLISLGDDPDSGDFGTLASGKYWTVATGGVCDNNNSSNKVNVLLNYIKAHISAL